MFQMIKAKLEPASIKGVFVGYTKASKDYRIYNPTQRKNTIWTDVKLNEAG